jgi:hypothetical protein
LTLDRWLGLSSSQFEGRGVDDVILCHQRVAGQAIGAESKIPAVPADWNFSSPA